MKHRCDRGASRLMGTTAAVLDADRIVAEYEAGETLRALELRYHTSRFRLKKLLSARGVEIRHVYRRRDPPYYPDDPLKLLALALIESACQDYDADRYPWTKRVRSTNDARAKALEYFESRAFLADCEVAELDERTVLLARGEGVLDLVGEKWYNGSTT